MDEFLSIVVPAYNEKENLPILVQEIREGASATDLPFEIIIVDDGSTDGTTEELCRLAREIPELKAVILRRNFGQTAAMKAGFDKAKGTIICSMDGDLQNDPKDIPLLVKKIQEGYDLVSGWRKDRKDPFWSRKLPSKIANWIIGRTTGVLLHDYGCSLKAYRRDVAKNLLLYGELHRFIPVLAQQYGAKITEVPVNHRPRIRGKSKYGIGRTYRVILDLLLMLFFQKFATRPLQFFGLTGGLMAILGAGLEAYLVWVKLVSGEDIGNRPLLIFGMLFIITGVVLLGIGLLAELVIRTYFEASGRSIYSVREEIG
ncbi:Glycosyl transferase, family 2 [Dissulfuribacter thermophilus]|uniref:Glycosyl transferase, family 2 n=1 Tax=Dissulfuribacter thermophilus TaxID=1156395 RepID=A0A1B9F3N5_9BACT|nr:glycosyltransferase family 2 protein [Dissulfuribacter thermophilus]OCC14444.1 Glycosyl transferase, family 2 [Dissulfuribacter thermophilus]